MNRKALNGHERCFLPQFVEPATINGRLRKHNFTVVFSYLCTPPVGRQHIKLGNRLVFQIKLKWLIVLVANKIIEIMENAVKLKIPNKVDYESGDNWGDIYD